MSERSNQPRDSLESKRSVTGKGEDRAWKPTSSDPEFQYTAEAAEECRKKQQEIDLEKARTLFAIAHSVGIDGALNSVLVQPTLSDVGRGPNGYEAIMRGKNDEPLAKKLKYEVKEVKEVIKDVGKNAANAIFSKIPGVHGPDGPEQLESSAATAGDLPSSRANVETKYVAVQMPSPVSNQSSKGGVNTPDSVLDADADGTEQSASGVDSMDIATSKTRPEGSSEVSQDEDSTNAGDQSTRPRSHGNPDLATNLPSGTQQNPIVVGDSRIQPESGSFPHPVQFAPISTPETWPHESQTADNDIPPVSAEPAKASRLPPVGVFCVGAQSRATNRAPDGAGPTASASRPEAQQPQSAHSRQPGIGASPQAMHVNSNSAAERSRDGVAPTAPALGAVIHQTQSSQLRQQGIGRLLGAVAINSTSAAQTSRGVGTTAPASGALTQQAQMAPPTYQYIHAYHQAMAMNSNRAAQGGAGPTAPALGAVTQQAQMAPPTYQYSHAYHQAMAMNSNSAAQGSRVGGTGNEPVTANVKSETCAQPSHGATADTKDMDDVVKLMSSLC